MERSIAARRMCAKRTVCLMLALGVMFASVSCDEAAKPEDEQEHQNNVIPQSTGHPSELSIPSGVLTMLANGGVVAAMTLAVGALIVLIAPAFGLRFCSIFGTCGDATGYQGYSSPNAVYSDYQGYQQGTYNSPVYQKRSLEYVGPILKALGNAYEKYSRQASQVQAAANKD